MRENDAAPHFAPLLAILEMIVVTKEYIGPDVDVEVARNTAAASEAVLQTTLRIRVIRTSRGIGATRHPASRHGDLDRDERLAILLTTTHPNYRIGSGSEVLRIPEWSCRE